MVKEPQKPVGVSDKGAPHWVEHLFRNAPPEVQEKTKTSYWRAVDMLWHAVCFTAVFAIVGALEFCIFQGVGWLLRGTLSQNKWLANIWNNTQVGVAMLTIAAWVIHVLFSTFSQVALDYAYTFSRRKK